MGAVIGWLALGAFVLGLAGAAVASPAGPPSAAPEQTHWDPAVRHGVLPNGLRYAVMHNATPAGAVSIRLGIAAGSIDEADDELGAAHFLEHMAFGGSQAQLQTSIEKAFADAGVAFGRDRNAQTSRFDTVFKIDLPHGDPAALDLGFRWLRQVADAARLTPETVDRERGVILAERETRLSDLSEFQQRTIAFQAPGTRLARSGVIGTEASISHLTAAQLQAFYDRWYQPQDAFVVVVGDEPLDALEARVRATFGSWTPHGPPGPPRQPAKIDAGRGLDVMAEAGPNLPAAIGVCRLGPAPADQNSDMPRLRRETATAVWASIAQTRLSDALKSPDSGLLTGAALSSDLRGQAQATCFAGAPLDGVWDKALATLENAAGALAAAPPSEDELEAALKNLRSKLRGVVFGASTRETIPLADAMLLAISDDRPATSPLEALRVFDLAVEDMTPADVQAAFRRDWVGGGPLITLVAPDAPSAEAVKQAWLADKGARLPSSAQPAPPPVWHYADFGRAGRVVKRDVFADYVRVTFANGVRLNVKQTDFTRNSVSVRVRFGQGRRGLAPADNYAANIASVLLTRGGLERNSRADVAALFAEEGLEVRLRMLDDAYVMSSRAAPGSLPADLQLLAAYLTQPGFHSLDAVLKTYWAATLRTTLATPHALQAAAMVDAVAPGNPEGLKAAEAASGLTVADLQRVLKPALTTAPLEVTVVGDISETDAVAEVAATFGALPQRAPLPPARPDAWFLRFPVSPPPLITAHHEGPAEKAVLALYWPLYVAEPARRREEYALSLTALVYRDALLRRIRGDLGKSYSPIAATSMPDHGDQGYLVASADVTAPDIDAIRTEMTAIAAQIARGDFTDQDVENVRKPYLAARAQDLVSNEAWAIAMDNSAEDDTGLNDLKGLASLYGAVTPAEVRKAAATWLAKPPIVVIVSGKPSAVAP